MTTTKHLAHKFIQLLTRFVGSTANKAPQNEAGFAQAIYPSSAPQPSPESAGHAAKAKYASPKSADTDVIRMA